VDFGGLPPFETPAFASGGIPLAARTESFWGLGELSAAEEIIGIGPVLSGYQIDFMNPTPTVSNFNYRWQSTGQYCLVKAFGVRY
jgi:hypothetical protein